MTPWAENFLKNISTEIGDGEARSSFLKNAQKREKITQQIEKIWIIYQSYIYVLIAILFSEADHSVSFQHVSMLLAPLSLPLKEGVSLIDAALISQQDISNLGADLPQYSDREHTLWTNILNELICAVRDISCIVQSPSVAKISKRLKTVQGVEYTIPNTLFNAYHVAAKGLFLASPRSGNRTGGVPVLTLDKTALRLWDGFESIWYNFCRTLEPLLDMMAESASDDYLNKFLASKEITTVLFKVLKTHLYADLVDRINGSAAADEESDSLELVVNYFTVATSQLQIENDEGDFTKSEKEGLKYLAGDEIQKDVSEAMDAFYKLAITSKHFTPGFRMKLCWCAINVSCMYGTAYMLHHGCGSYLSMAVLAKADVMAKCWVAIIHYYSELNKKKKNDWIEYCFNGMSSWPRCFVKLIGELYLEKSESKSTNSPPPTVFDRTFDPNRMITTMESLCHMGATFPFLLISVENFSIGAGVLKSLNPAIAALGQDAEHIITRNELLLDQVTLLVHPMISMVASAMKYSLNFLSLPWSALLRAIRSCSNGTDSGLDESVKFEFVYSAFLGTIWLLERAVSPSGIFKCPAGCEKRLTALALVVIHVMQSFPPNMEETSPRFLMLLSKSVPRMRISETLPSVVLPRDVPKGIDRLIACSKQYLGEYMDALTEERQSGRMRAGDFKKYKQERLKHDNSLKNLIREATNVSETGNAEREVKRCEVLAVLDCSWVGCTRFRSPGREVLESKKCGSCKIAHYCSPECQKKDWKFHKIACKCISSKALGGS